MSWKQSDISKLPARYQKQINDAIGKQEPKKSKHGNLKMLITLQDGTECFADSKKEGFRWNELKFLETLGEISQLKRQVVFQLSVCKYVADACYFDKSGLYIVEDTKSSHTRKLPVYRLKKKMMLKELGITIKEF